jgi:hypothetical protein
MDDWKEALPLSRGIAEFIRVRFGGGVGGGGGGGAGARARSNCCILSACVNIRFGAGAGAPSSLNTVPSAYCGALLDELRCLR